MRLNILRFSPIVFLYLTTAQIVAGCENGFNCTECLRFDDCKFLRCAKTSHCLNKTDENINCRTKDDIDIETIIDVQYCLTTDSTAYRSNGTVKAITDSPIVNKPIDTITIETTSAMSRARTRTSTQTIPTPTSNSTTTVPSSVSSPLGHSATSITRRFDGPSFIGGIILTIGILAVTYVGFKFYRARTERNYHTLPGI